MVNTSVYKASTQDFTLRLALKSPRDFRLMDAAEDGSDAGAPDLDPEQDYAGAIDVRDIIVQGGVNGSVTEGGYSTNLLIRDAVASLDEFIGVELIVLPVHGNRQLDSVRIIKGYAQNIRTKTVWPSTEVTFDLKSSHQFTQGSSFGRGFDWGPGLAHSGFTALGAIDHLLTQHSNLLSRSSYSARVAPMNTDRFNIGAVSLHQALQSLLANSIEGWVYFDRDDNLHIRAHPNLAPADWADELSSPIIDYDDEFVLGWDVPEASGRTVAGVTLTATTSDVTTIAVNRRLSDGVGSNVNIGDLRVDSVGQLGDLADLYVPHANRKFREVVLDLPLNVVADIGNIVTCSHVDYWRGISWQQKKFVVTGVTYNIDTSARKMTGSVTLDEVVV